MNAEQELLHLRAVLTDLVDLFEWSDASPLHAVMHAQAAVLNLRADAAVARAEVARLRAEAHELRLLVEEAARAENANAEDARRERAAVVAWLREEERLHETHGSRFVASSLRRLGDIIERGEHRREEE